MFPVEPRTSHKSTQTSGCSPVRPGASGGLSLWQRCLPYSRCSVCISEWVLVEAKSPPGREQWAHICFGLILLVLAPDLLSQKAPQADNLIQAPRRGSLPYRCRRVPFLLNLGLKLFITISMVLQKFKHCRLLTFFFSIGTSVWISLEHSHVSTWNWLWVSKSATLSKVTDAIKCYKAQPNGGLFSSVTFVDGALCKHLKSGVFKNVPSEGTAWSCHRAHCWPSRSSDSNPGSL